MTLTDAEFEAMGLVDLGDFGSLKRLGLGEPNFRWVLQ